jgi:hypothetical protein
LAHTLIEREELVLDDTFRRRFRGIVAASLVMGAVLLALMQLLDPWFAPAGGIVRQAAALLALIASGLIAYGAAAELFGAVRLKTLLASLRGA